MGKTVIAQVDYTSRGSDGTTVSETLSDVTEITVRQNTDDNPNTVEIEFQNAVSRFSTGFSEPFGKYTSDTNDFIFKEGDGIKVYIAELKEFREMDTSTGSADLIISAQIEEPSIKGSKDGTVIDLKCTDRTYAMFNRVHTRAYTDSEGLGADDIIIDVVRNVSDVVEADSLSYDSSGNLVSNGIYSVDARKVSAGGFVEDTRIDGSSFPTLSIAKNAQSAYTWFRDLSTTDSTNDFASDDEDSPTQDRSMVFYVDELNRFHWFYPRDGASTLLNGAINDSVTTITVVSTTNFPSSGVFFIGSERITYTGKTSTTFTGCTRGTNNTEAQSHSDGATVSSILQVVEGDNSNGIEVIDKNLSKKIFDIVNHVIFECGPDLQGNGMLFNFFDRNTKTKELMETYKPYDDIARDLAIGEIRAGNLIEDNTQTDFVFQGRNYRANTYGFTTVWGVDTSGFSDSDYNQAFRDEAQRLGTIRAQRLTRRRSTPRWKGTIQTTFYRYVPGELVEFTSTFGGLNKVQVRITTVTYSFRKGGCFVTLNVEEDEPKLRGVA